MSEHVWSQENIAAYVGGGLSASETERVEAHARECPECAAVLAGTLRLDRALGGLFADVQPGPELEDRAIRKFREARVRRAIFGRGTRRLLVAAGVTIFLGMTGAMSAAVMQGGQLPLPGSVGGGTYTTASLIGRLGLGDKIGAETRTDLTNEDTGLHSFSTFLGSLIYDDATKGDKEVTRINGESNTDNVGKPNAPDNSSEGRAIITGRGHGQMPEMYGRRGYAVPNTDGSYTGDVKEMFLASDSPASGEINLNNLQDSKAFSSVAGNGPWENSLGYYPPARALVVRGTTRDHPPTNNLEDAMVKELKLKPPAAQPAIQGTPLIAMLPYMEQGPSTQARFQPGNFKLPHSAPTFAAPADATPRPSVSVMERSPTGSKPAGSTTPDDHKQLYNFSLDGRLGQLPPALGATPLPSVQEPAPQPKPATPSAPAPEPAKRVVIRSGDIEFEVESFDAAAATVTKIVAGIKGALIATTNSDRLPNGKMKGSIAIRVPPESLDGLVLDLRRELGKNGELKGVKIGSQDITKQYTDLESRLRAARTMEQRLRNIIKDGKGDIKALVEAEKELGVWLTKIEEFEGELRYYGNLVALSTLTVSLVEKEIRAAARLTESERVQAGVEVEDVDKAYHEVLAAVAEANGRVIKSDMKQLTGGQFNASLHFEAAPEAAGPIRDRLHQLGRVARLEIDHVQQAEGTVEKTTKAKRGDTVFLVQLYNIANIAPREAAVLQVAVVDVPAAYQTLRDAVAKTTGRVLVAQLNEQDKQNVTANLDFEVRRTQEATIRTALDLAGEVVARQVVRAAESDNVTDAKILYRVAMLPANRLKPRETDTLTVEVPDVDARTAVFAAQVGEAKGRQVDSSSNRDRAGHTTTHMVFEVPLAAASGLVERFKAAGTVRAQQSARDPQAPDGKYATARIDVTLTTAEQIVNADAGIGPQVRRGLAYSVSVLLTSLTWVVFGLCVVLPWVVLGYGGYRLVRWVVRPTRTAVS